MIRSMRRLTAGLCVAAGVCLSGCGGGGDDDPDLTFEGGEGVQASVAIVRSTISLLIGMRSEGAPVATSGAACTAGNLDTSCEVENRMSIVTGSFDECRVPLVDGNRLTADGSLRIETNDVGVCVTGRIPDTATRSLRYRDFEQILSDSGGNELMRSVVEGTDRIVPLGEGCAGRDLIETVDATSDQVVHYRAAGRLAADGVDAKLRARGLQLTQTSVGAPCERSIMVDGEMEIDDRANGLHYTQTAAALSIAYTEEDDTAVVNVSGSLINDCVGDLAVMTIEPLRIHAATECPTGGALHVSLDGEGYTATFGLQGQLSIKSDNGAYFLVGSGCQWSAQCSR